MSSKPNGESIAIYPGTFDPITNGHLDIVERGLRVFERVRLAILINPEKKPLFSIDERVALIRDTYVDNPRVEVDTFSGLLVDYADTAGATVEIDGRTEVVRAGSALGTDTGQHARYFNHLLKAGVYLPPSQFEACFLSTAHQERDLNKTLRAVKSFR